MSSTNKTENYNLPQWIGTDKPTFLGDFNGAFLSIDQGIYEAKTLAENMSSTNKTENYNLPQWIGTDKPTFLGDFNGAFLSIDQGIYEAKTLAENASEIAAQANTSATNNAPRLAKAESDITTLKAGLTNVQNLQEINKITLIKLPVKLKHSDPQHQNQELLLYLIQH